jgi:hypothetical protein
MMAAPVLLQADGGLDYCSSRHGMRKEVAFSRRFEGDSRMAFKVQVGPAQIAIHPDRIPDHALWNGPPLLPAMYARRHFQLQRWLRGGLAAMRGPGESYSDVIVRLAKG